MLPARESVKRSPAEHRRGRVWPRRSTLPTRSSDKERQVTRDPTWISRTYSGHSSPKASDELYRANLAKGQTGLSIAFDLATRCGYDSDDRIARLEVGKVGVPVNSLDDFHVLFEAIPIEKMNTSMTTRCRR
ncbi:MAG TPA: methylmalonyl-CoA mutase family protein [Polyangiaceae bacterium]|nr:methylmalonyl-CoA mutase family protein [Polyangiaceae bacterium]